jgi:tetratricopeptide (TPR) repeat protein
MRDRSCLWIVLLLWPLAVPAARRIADFDVVCPLFGHRFTAQSLVEDDAASAYDSDFCKRSRGDSPYVLAVWTCPYCFFSAYQADFRGSLEPRFRDLPLRKYPIDPEKAQQVDIFVGTKYLNAEAYYRDAGRDARFLADLVLRGSYACRVFGPPEAPEFDLLMDRLTSEVLEGKDMRSVEVVSRRLAGLAAERIAAGKVPDDQVAIYRYLEASALRQAGERLEAQRRFEELDKDRRLPASYQRNAGQQAFLCLKEGEFQQKTLDYLAAARAQGLIPAAELPRAVYMMGEMSRRLGRPEEARRFYREAAALEGAEEFLRVMIRQQEERLPASGEGS